MQLKQRRHLNCNSATTVQQTAEVLKRRADCPQNIFGGCSQGYKTKLQAINDWASLATWMNEQVIATEACSADLSCHGELCHTAMQV